MSSWKISQKDVREIVHSIQYNDEMTQEQKERAIQEQHEKIIACQKQSEKLCKVRMNLIRKIGNGGFFDEGVYRAFGADHLSPRDPCVVFYPLRMHAILWSKNKYYTIYFSKYYQSELTADKISEEIFASYEKELQCTYEDIDRFETAFYLNLVKPIVT